MDLNRIKKFRIKKFVRGIADDAFQDLYVRGGCREVILPMVVQRSFLDGKSFVMGGV